MGVPLLTGCLASTRDRARSREQIGSSVRDESVKIDLDSEQAFRALMKVDPDSEPVEDEKMQ